MGSLGGLCYKVREFALGSSSRNEAGPSNKPVAANCDQLCLGKRGATHPDWNRGFTPATVLREVSACHSSRFDWECDGSATP